MEQLQSELQNGGLVEEMDSEQKSEERETLKMISWSTIILLIFALLPFYFARNPEREYQMDWDDEGNFVENVKTHSLNCKT